MTRRAAVIGSGFGGLALAIRLQSAGIATTVIEARDKPGGRAYFWEKNGHVFDAGPTVITDPACLRELWELTGADMAADVELLPVSPFYRLSWPDGTTFDYVNDDDELEQQIAKLEPDDVAGYRRFLSYSAGVYREGYERLGAVPFLDFKSMLSAAPKLARYQAWRSVYSMVSSFVKNDKMRQALSFHTLLVGGNPLTTSAIYSLIHKLERDGGVWFAKGGTNALIAAMVRLFERLGGTLRLGDPVAAIETIDNRATAVRTASGWTGEFDAVASNADIVRTYDMLAGPRGKQAARRLRRKRFSPSLFVVHFSTDRTWPDVPHHSVLFGPRYGGLVNDIYKGRQLASDPSIYLHHPTATDPSVAPAGKSTFYALAPVPHLGSTAVDWERDGAAYAERMIEVIEQRMMPGLSEAIDGRFSFGPVEFERELNSHLGSAFSLEPVLTQSAFFRVHNRDDVVRNLYFVGAGTHPGAGIPGVVGSAKATAGLMIADLAGVNRDEIVAEARRSIEIGSKSFRAASRLFDPQTRERAWLLYCWCRYCDDVCDGQVFGFGHGRSGDVALLRERTRQAIAGQPVDELPFRALALLNAECPIPVRLLDDHLAGFELDDAGWVPRTEADLAQYCYHVAGAVGCMMAIVMGVAADDAPTLKAAADLGIAFQLSNIARDVREDLEAGRCYLPRDWLAEFAVTPATLYTAEARPALVAMVARLTERVRHYEDGARLGVDRLSFRSRLAVLAALRIYGAIGRRVERLGGSAWDQRVTVGKLRKLGLLVPSLAEAALSGPR